MILCTKGLTEINCDVIIYKHSGYTSEDESIHKTREKAMGARSVS